MCRTTGTFNLVHKWLKQWSCNHVKYDWVRSIKHEVSCDKFRRSDRFCFQVFQPQEVTCKLNCLLTSICSYRASEACPSHLTPGRVRLWLCPPASETKPLFKSKGTWAVPGMSNEALAWSKSCKTYCWDLGPPCVNWAMFSWHSVGQGQVPA